MAQAGLGRVSLLAFAASVATMIPPLLILFFVRQHGVDIPFWDDWDETPLVVAFYHGTLTFADLWAPHNEHHILTSRLTLFGLDLLLHGGNSVSRIFIGIVAALLTLGGLVVLAFRLLDERSALILTAVFSAILFSSAQFENWVWGFQIGWFYVNAALVWSIVLLSNRTRRWESFVFAAFLGASATASLASGLVVWVADFVPIALVPSRDRIPRALGWAGLTVAATVIFFAGRPSSGISPSHELAYIAPVLGYSLTFLGSPVFGWLGNPGMAIAGAVVVGVSMLICVAVARDLDRARAMRALPWMTLVAFAFADAAITAFGRAVIGIDQAGSSRYVTVSQLAWIGMIGVVAVYWPVFVGRARYAALGVGFLSAIAFVADQQHFGPAFEGATTEMGIVRSAILSGTATDAQLQTIYPNAAAERRYIEELRSVGEGPLGTRP